MNSYPEYARVGHKKYKINTDYRIALECEKVAKDESISDYERPLAIIYLLFGEDAIKDFSNLEKLMNIAEKYLKCGKESIDESDEESNMSFEQDWSYIQASFMTDYRINLNKEKMHWWMFSDLMNGLTENCVLNRIRFIRDYDISGIKDQKELNKWIKMKKTVELKKEKTKEEKEADELFDRLMKGE